MSRCGWSATGPVTTVIMNRPEARNAVNGPTAAALFAAFERVRRRRHRVGRGALGRQRNLLRRSRSQGVRHAGGQRGAPDGTRADGTDADGAVQAGDRGGQRLRRRRRSRAGAVVRSAGRRGGRGVRGVLPALGRAADRRRHGAAAAADRAEPRDGHDPDRPRRSRPPKRCAIGLANRVVPKGQARQRPRSSRRNWPRCRSSACAPIGCRRCTQWGMSEARRIDVRIRQHVPGGRRRRWRGRTVRRRCGPARRARELARQPPFLMALPEPRLSTFGSPSL